MPKKGFKQSESHKKKRFIRGNGWLGRKHRKESIEKMRRPKSDEQVRHMCEAQSARWPEYWEKEVEPLPPILDWDEIDIL